MIVLFFGAFVGVIFISVTVLTWFEQKKENENTTYMAIVIMCLRDLVRYVFYGNVRNEVNVLYRSLLDFDDFGAVSLHSFHLTIKPIISAYIVGFENIRTWYDNNCFFVSYRYIFVSDDRFRDNIEDLNRILYLKIYDAFEELYSDIPLEILKNMFYLEFIQKKNEIIICCSLNTLGEEYIYKQRVRLEFN